MDTLQKNFNEFVSRRLSHIESLSQPPYDEAADTLEKSLKHEQKMLLHDALFCAYDAGTIHEDIAYRMGFADGIQSARFLFDYGVHAE